MIENQMLMSVKQELQREPEQLLIGIHAVNIDLFSKQLAQNPDHYALFFTPDERAYCQDRINSYAGRVAAKVAVMQVLNSTVPWQTINIRALDTGAPDVTLCDESQQKALDALMTNMQVTISHDEGIAVAMALPNTKVDTLRDPRLGIDITAVPSHIRLLGKYPERYLRKVYTPAEIDEIEADPVKAAEKWAAKEAVAKALGTGIWRQGVDWKHIALLNDCDGSPRIQCTGGAANVAESLGITNWRIGIAKSDTTPVAFVIGHS